MTAPSPFPHAAPPTRRTRVVRLAALALALGLAAVLPLAGAPAAPAERATPAGLRAQLAAASQGTGAPGALWGVAVVRASDGRPVFQTNQHRLFTPASNTKLFTTALALDRLGADFRLQTTLSTSAAPGPDGTVRGDLIVEGGGDPGFRPRHGASLAQVFDTLAAPVRKAGIKRITGDLVADDSFLHAAPYGSGWNWDDLVESYGAAVSALTANDSAARVLASPGAKPGVAATLRVEPDLGVLRLAGRVATGPANSEASVRYQRLPGSDTAWLSGHVPAGGKSWEESLAVPDPARFFALLLREALSRAGVGIEGAVRIIHWAPGNDAATTPPGRTVLARVPSAPLVEIVRDCLKPSQNLHAQLLLLRVGAEVRLHPRAGEPAAADTDEETGLRALDAFLRRIGATPGSWSFEEGSGLSRKNLVTPDATIRLLRAMESHPAGRGWRDGFPVGGRDGTLRSRFREAPALDHVRAKSGALRHVGSLSGEVTTAAGERLLFAVYVNNHANGNPDSSPRPEIDRLVTLLAAHNGPAVE